MSERICAKLLPFVTASSKLLAITVELIFMSATSITPTGTHPNTRLWQELPASRFDFDKFCLRAGVASSQIFTLHNKLVDGVEPLGYCEASKLAVRPRKHGYAILVWLEDEGVDVWCHVAELPDLG